jgi:hypothetical protein
MLTSAYLRRKKWEFRGLAVAVVNAMNESMGGGKRDGTYVNGYREIPTDAMFERIGG